MLLANMDQSSCSHCQKSSGRALGNVTRICKPLQLPGDEEDYKQEDDPAVSATHLPPSISNIAGLITEDINSSDSESEEEYRTGVESKPATGSLDSERNSHSILDGSNADSDTEILSSDEEEIMKPREFL